MLKPSISKIPTKYEAQRIRYNFLSTLIVVITALVTWELSFILQLACQPFPKDGLSASGHPLGSEITPLYNQRKRHFTVRTEKKHDTFSSAFQNKDDLPSRIFPKFRHPFPCFDSGNEFMMNNTPAHEGILFQRPQKTGSTTMVGVVLRLAHNGKKKEKNVKRCKLRAMHGSALSMDYGGRDPSKSFLFSILRHPTKRAISDFFHFRVTAFQVTPTDKIFREHALNLNFDNYLRDLTTRNYTANKTVQRDDFASIMGYKSFKEIPHENRVKEQRFRSFKIFGNHTTETVVRDILEDYDFIALMERMDESLVAFQMLLGLTTKEIVYTRARSSGSFSNGWHDRPCMYIIPSFLSEGMKQFFDSKEWLSTIENDLSLYQAVNRSLDRTIDALGRGEFEVNLKALQRGLALAEENCKGKVKGMCNEGGDVIPLKDRTCYVWSEGCDHACIDELDL